MLTPNQEQYCKNRAIKRMSQRKAYIDAYPNAKEWKSGTVDSRACELESKSEILGRIKELSDEQTAIMSQEAAWTRKDALNELNYLIEKAKEEINYKGEMRGPNVSAIINAVKELNNIFDVTAEATEPSDDGFIEALSGQAKEVWDDEENGDVPI